MKIVLGLSLLLIVITVYNSWDTFVITVAEMHKTLHALLASHIRAVSENAFNYGGALVAFSFFYGAFHAVGPGHGKAVILTYLGTHKESMWKGIFISLSAAMLQSCIAIGLVSALAIVLKFNLAEVKDYGNNVAVVSYFMIIMLGLTLVSTSIHRLRKLRHASKHSDHYHYSHSDSDSHSHNSHTHHHDSGCGCSHAHVPEENQSLWRTLTVILSMGFRPCSGAIVVLIYAHLVGVYFYGVIAALMMGLGTGLLVSVVAIAAHLARSKLERLVARSNKISFYPRLSISNYLRCIGGVFLVFLGWSLYSATLTTSSHQHLF
ncbi:nickel/cobalt transporter [Spartinivicinus poritis]|uniref:Nickel/cobalt efflux system n=1 Tax=Spartinivicinus poritis TaxID=2994640 RepID=A0ABT5U833_9GAMM|nr:hypothetical protein [Spartinivicinus sp. A2-2]MDE1461309.1 hypothetical protein [Spartinivicinus sp. A2-2]